MLRVGPDAQALDLARVHRAARICGVPVIESHHTNESQDVFAARLSSLDVERVRVIGEQVGEVLHRSANEANVHVAAVPVLGSGRIELLHYLREQAISRTLHRFGNLTGAPTSSQR